MLKKRFRLTKKDNIGRIIQEGKRCSSSLYLAKLLPNSLGYVRVAVIISKKVEKKAVRRNKCRRRVFEALRSMSSIRDKSLDIVILLNKNAISSSFDTISKVLKDIVL